MSRTPGDATAPDSPRLLAVDLSPAIRSRLEQRTGLDVESVTFSRLNVAVLARVRPDAVIAPLITEGHDILDLCRRLTAFGFGGQVYVMADPLPDAEAVLREIRAECDLLSVDFLAPGDLAGS